MSAVAVFPTVHTPPHSHFLDPLGRDVTLIEVLTFYPLLPAPLVGDSLPIINGLFPLLAPLTPQLSRSGIQL